MLKKARFKSRNLSRFNTKSSNFSKRFNTGYRQYVANFEGDFDNNDDNLEDAFGTLLVDYKDDSSGTYASTHKSITLRTKGHPHKRPYK